MIDSVKRRVLSPVVAFWVTFVIVFGTLLWINDIRVTLVFNLFTVIVMRWMGGRPNLHPSVLWRRFDEYVFDPRSYPVGIGSCFPDAPVNPPSRFSCHLFFDWLAEGSISSKTLWKAWELPTLGLKWIPSRHWKATPLLLRDGTPDELYDLYYPRPVRRPYTRQEFSRLQECISIYEAIAHDAGLIDRDCPCGNSHDLPWPIECRLFPAMFWDLSHEVRELIQEFEEWEDHLPPLGQEIFHVEPLDDRDWESQASGDQLGETISYRDTIRIARMIRRFNNFEDVEGVRYLFEGFPEQPLEFDLRLHFEPRYVSYLDWHEVQLALETLEKLRLLDVFEYEGNSLYFVRARWEYITPPQFHDEVGPGPLSESQIADLLRSSEQAISLIYSGFRVDSLPSFLDFAGRVYREVSGEAVSVTAMQLLTSEWKKFQLVQTEVLKPTLAEISLKERVPIKTDLVMVDGEEMVVLAGGETPEPFELLEALDGARKHRFVRALHELMKYIFIFPILSEGLVDNLPEWAAKALSSLAYAHKVDKVGYLMELLEGLVDFVRCVAKYFKTGDKKELSGCLTPDAELLVSLQERFALAPLKVFDSPTEEQIFLTRLYDDAELLLKKTLSNKNHADKQALNQAIVSRLHVEVTAYVSETLQKLYSSDGRIPTYVVALIGASGIGKTTFVVPNLTAVFIEALGKSAEGGHVYDVPNEGEFHEGAFASTIGLRWDDPITLSKYPPGKNPLSIFHDAAGGAAVYLNMAFARKGMRVCPFFGIMTCNMVDMGIKIIGYQNPLAGVRRGRRWFVSHTDIANKLNGVYDIHSLTPEQKEAFFVFRKIVPKATGDLEGTYTDELSQPYTYSQFLAEVRRDFLAHRSSGKALLDRNTSIKCCSKCGLPEDTHFSGNCPNRSTKFSGCSERVCPACKFSHRQHIVSDGGKVSCPDALSDPGALCECGTPIRDHVKSLVGGPVVESPAIREDYIPVVDTFTEEKTSDVAISDRKNSAAIRKKVGLPPAGSMQTQSLVIQGGFHWMIVPTILAIVLCATSYPWWAQLPVALLIWYSFDKVSDTRLIDLPTFLLVRVILVKIWFHSQVAALWHQHFGVYVHQLVLQDHRRDLFRLQAIEKFQRVVKSPWLRVLMAAFLGAGLLRIASHMQAKFETQGDREPSTGLMDRKQTKSLPTATILTCASLEGNDYILEEPDVKLSNVLPDDVFLERLKDQTIQFSVVWTNSDGVETLVSKSWLVAVCGNLVASTKHIFPDWCTSFEIRFSTPKRFGFSQTGSFIYERKNISFSKNMDLAFFSWPLPIPRDLLPNIFSLRELSRIQQASWTNPRGESVSGKFECVTYPLGDVGDVRAWYGPSVSVSGDCGTPLIATIEGKKILIGILCAGDKKTSPSSTGLYSIICRESIRRAYSELKEKGQPVSGPIPPEEFQFLADTECVGVGELSGNSSYHRIPIEMEPMGVVKGTFDFVQGAKYQTMMFQTPFGEALGCRPERWTPASAAGVERLNPDGSTWKANWKIVWIEGVAQAKAVFKPRARALAREKMLRMFRGVVGARSWDYLTLDQAVRGIPGTVLGPLPKSTSSGCVKYKGDKTPYVEVSPIPGDPDNVILTAGIRQACLSVVQGIQAGFAVVLLFLVMPKMNEVLKVEKAKEKPARAINCCSVVFNILLRKYAGPLIILLSTPLLAWGSAVGINVLSPQWSLAHDRVALGESGPRSKFSDADTKRMDFTLTSWDRWYFVYGLWLDVIRPTFDPTEYRILHALFIAVCWFYAAMNGDVVALASCLPTGVYTTAMENTTVTLAFILYAYYQSALEAGIPEMDIPDPEKVLGFIMFGDDLLFSADDSVSEWFNPRTYRSTLAAAGVTVTFGTNKDADPQWKRIEDCTFLKRGFRFENGFWWAPLEMDSIEKMLSWYQPSKALPREEHFAVILENAGKEFFVHGQSEYEKRLPGLQAAAELHCKRPLSALKSYPEMLEDFKRGKFQAW